MFQNFDQRRCPFCNWVQTFWVHGENYDHSLMMCARCRYVYDPDVHRPSVDQESERLALVNSRE